jgi:hypothetical protein
MKTNHVLPINLDDMLTILVEWIDENEEVSERKLFDELDEFEQEQVLTIIETDEYKNDMFNDAEYY